MTKRHIIVEKIIVSDVPYGTRIYDYLPGQLTALPSRKAVKKAFKKKRIYLNEKLAQEANWIKKGDCVTLTEEFIPLRKVFPLQLEVLFEDEFIAIVNKPPGIPTSGNFYKTLQQALPFNLQKSKESDALVYPQPAHRLDKATRGLVIIAKTHRARMKLGEMFERRLIQKKYYAIVHGKIQCNGKLTSSIEGKNSLTHFTPIYNGYCKKKKPLTLLELSPLTGRKHQLRIHLSRLGYPILGDIIYGNQNQTLLHKGLFLQAHELQFKHPKTDELLKFKIELPYKFKKRIHLFK